MGGLEELGSKCRVDMIQLIYHAMESVDELDAKFAKAVSQYGHNEKSLIFIDILNKSNKKNCATLTQYIFTFGHCTIVIREGWNESLKGYGALRSYLSTCNLCTIIT